MAVKFKIGDKVTISKKSKYYKLGNGDKSSNPPDMEGVVDDVYGRSELCVGVKWKNGQHNAYNHSDLVFFKPTIVKNGQIYLCTKEYKDRFGDTTKVGTQWKVLSANYKLGGRDEVYMEAKEKDIVVTKSDFFEYFELAKKKADIQPTQLKKETVMKFIQDKKYVATKSFTSLNHNKIVKGRQYTYEGMASSEQALFGTSASTSRVRKADMVNFAEVGSVVAKPVAATAAPTPTADTFTVDAAFIKQAHGAACSEWKGKLEKKFPKVFEKPKPKEFVFKEGFQLGTGWNGPLVIGAGLAPAGLEMKCLFVDFNYELEVKTHNGYQMLVFKKK